MKLQSGMAYSRLSGYIIKKLKSVLASSSIMNIIINDTTEGALSVASFEKRINVPILLQLSLL